MFNRKLKGISHVHLFILVVIFVGFTSGEERRYPTCQNPLGMENGAIKDYAITASSSLDRTQTPARARLNLKSDGDLKGAWTGHIDDPHAWIQVHFLIPVTITAVATQGHAEYAQWVKSFSLEYSRNNGSHLVDYENGLELTGNSDHNTTHTSILELPIKSINFIRIVPRSWEAFISLRFELYGCKSDAIVGFRDTSLLVSEKAGEVPICVFRDGLPNVPLNISLKATRNTNIPKAPSFVVFAPNDLSLQTCFNLTIHDNNVVDHNNTAHLSLSTDDLNVFVRPKELTINILEDDRAVIGLKKTFFSVSEHAGNVSVCVLIQGIVAGSINVKFASDSNAIKWPSSVTFAFDKNQTCFDLIIQDNNILEHNKTVHLFLGSVDNPHVLINETQKQLTVFIVDDDQVTIHFENKTATVEEDVIGGRVDLALVMNGVTAIPFDVKLVVNQDGADTAKEGLDFKILSKDVIFTSGKKRIIIHAYIQDDSEVENMEFFTVNILVPNEPRAVVGNPSKVLVKIGDSSDIEKAKAFAGKQKLDEEQSNEEKSAKLLMTVLVVAGSLFGIALTIGLVIIIMYLREKKKKRTDEES